MPILLSGSVQGGECLVKKKILKGLPAQLGLERKIGKGIIDYLSFNLLYICNYNCRKCFLGTTLSKNSLSLKDRKRVLSEARDLGARVVVISGEGEPLLVPDIKKIIDYQYKLGFTTVLFTNVSHLTEDWAIFGRDHNVSFIFTLDSMDCKTYDYLTRTKGNFDKVIENIMVCREVYKDTASNADGVRIVRLAINNVITLQNKNEIAKIKRWCGNDMVFICNYMVREGTAIEFWDDLCGDHSRYRELQSLAKKNSETNGPSSTAFGGKCAYLHNGLSINADGSVVLCHAARETKGLLGNVKESSLKQLKKRIDKLLTFFPKSACVVRHSKYASFLKNLKLSK